MRVLLCCCCIFALAAEDLTEKPAPVDDPFGLGERLALIDHLRETEGQEVAAGTTLAELRRLYWQVQAAKAAPSQEEILEREGLQRLRDEIHRRFNIDVDGGLDMAGLQALKQQLIDESMVEVEAMVEAEQEAGGPDQRQQDFGAIIEQARKSVVLIATETGSGSGFFISHNGTLLTNRHVCPTVGAEVRVYWDSALERPMERFRVERVSDERDCAYLRPLRANPPYHFLQRSREAELGQGVIAIGFPLGASVGQNLGTNAIDISANRGSITGLRRRGDLLWFLQSDCAISQGNSGGPLLDAHSGRVVGMVTAGIDPRDSGAHGSLMVFSIPIESVFNALHL